jgi:hypothetical protein
MPSYEVCQPLLWAVTVCGLAQPPAAVRTLLPDKLLPRCVPTKYVVLRLQLLARPANV